MKRVVAGLAAIAMVFGLAGAASTGLISFDNTIVADAAPASGFSYTSNSMQNEYLKMEFGISSFNLYTTGGNPDTNTDDNQRLLYPGYSYTTVRIDGVNNKYATDNLTIDEANQSAFSTSTIGGIEVTRRFTFTPNQNTGRRDSVEMSYTVKNVSNVSKNVGLRMMLDTCLGPNDKAPFRIPGIGDVTSERTFDGNAIPATFQAVDDLRNPSVVSSGSFLSGPVRPDQVQFAYLFNVDGDPDIIGGTVDDAELWGYQTQGRTFGDSAVTATWNERSLAPGESRTYTIHYGLSEVNQNANTDISLTGMIPRIATYNAETDSFANFDVTGILSNISDGDLENAWMRIVLPDGMSLVDPNAQPEEPDDSSSEAETPDDSSSETETPDDSSETETPADSSETETPADSSETEAPADSSEDEAPAESEAAPEDSSDAAEDSSSESTETTPDPEPEEPTTSSSTGSTSSSTESIPALPQGARAAADDTETPDEPADEDPTEDTAVSDTITTALLEADGELSGGWTVSIADDIARERYYDITILAGADGVEEVSLTRSIYVGLNEPTPTPSTPDSSSTPSSSTTSTTSTPGNANATKEANPATGTAAVLGSMALLAAAAVVVSRKK